jgi:hypothetical protein
MKYKLENISTKIGNGVRISENDKIYEQINCGEGFYARIMKAPGIEFENKDDNFEEYRGIIFKPLEANETDYKKFKTLTDRLQNISGENIPNTKEKFMDYIFHTGLEKRLDKIPARVKINKESEKIYNEKTNSWLNSKSRPWGFAAATGLYLSGFPIILNLNLSEPALIKTLAFYTTLLPAEGFSGLIPLLESRFGWCGLLNAVGFIPSRNIYLKKIENPEYMLDKFIKNNNKLEKISGFAHNKKRFEKKSKFADKYMNILEELFPHTKKQKGFSINYTNPDREKIVELFDYVLRGGKFPSLITPQSQVSPITKARTSKPKREKVKIKSPKTNFINPWEIDIPQIEKELLF